MHLQVYHQVEDIDIQAEGPHAEFSIAGLRVTLAKQEISKSNQPDAGTKVARRTTGLPAMIAHPPVFSRLARCS